MTSFEMTNSLTTVIASAAFTISLLLAGISQQLVHALPTFEVLDKKFNELVNNQIAPELRPLTQNLTENQKDMLGSLAFITPVYGQNVTTNATNSTSIELPDCSQADTPSSKAACEALIGARLELEARRALPPVIATEPQLYDEDTIPYAEIPYPQEGQIEIRVWAGGDNNSDRLGWHGNIMYDDGDITSYEGIHEDTFILDCADGAPYSMTFQKSDRAGFLDVTIYDHEGGTPVDSGDTYAAYGIVRLVGTC